MPDEPSGELPQPPLKSLFQRWAEERIEKPRDIEQEVKNEMVEDGVSTEGSFAPEILIDNFKKIFESAQQTKLTNEGIPSYTMKGVAVIFEDEDLRVVMRPTVGGSWWEEKFEFEPDGLEISLTSPRSKPDHDKMRQIEIMGKVFPEYLKLDDRVVRSKITYTLEYRDNSFRRHSDLEAIDNEDMEWYLNNKIFDLEKLETFTTEKFKSYTANNPYFDELFGGDGWATEMYQKLNPEDLEQLQTIFVNIKSGIMKQPLLPESPEA